MAVKQLSWRRSNQALSILMLISFPIASMDKSKPWHEQPNDFLDSTYVEGHTLLEMKNAYEMAPPMVKGCVKFLQNPYYYSKRGTPEYKALMLYGPSGSGKSTLARAIAQYAGWDMECVRPDDFQRGNRGDAAQLFRAKVDEIIARDAETVLIIDEGNGMFEHAESEHYDNDATTKAFWLAMDDACGKDKFFCIPTANRIHKVPSQIKTRLKCNTCKIQINSGDQAAKMLINIVAREQMRFPKNAKEPIAKIINENKHWQARDWKKFIFKIQQIGKDELNLDEVTEISPMLVSLADKAIKEEEKDFRYTQKDLTTEERQDLYQYQQLQQNTLMQVHQKNTVFGLFRPGIHQETARDMMEMLPTAEQKEIAQEHTQVPNLDRGWLGNLWNNAF